MSKRLIFLFIFNLIVVSLSAEMYTGGYASGSFAIGEESDNTIDVSFGGNIGFNFFYDFWVSDNFAISLNFLAEGHFDSTGAGWLIAPGIGFTVPVKDNYIMCFFAGGPSRVYDYSLAFASLNLDVIIPVKKNFAITPFTQSRFFTISHSYDLIYEFTAGIRVNYASIVISPGNTRDRKDRYNGGRGSSENYAKKLF